ncbi:hypothetical protein LUW76_38265 [Actinomadura madurae]|nr:hypothetical protein [Actinomadura madurae]URM99700.1 hypothetical protein LUW76_38265 [Actinomadura madurae]URN10363.1 hypothetical protein LUW74_48215 [Actinomadura madurae]
MKLAFGIDAGPDLTIRSASEACTQLAPTAYTADNVVEAWQGAADRPTISVIAETQKAVDHNKHGSWPLYVASQWDKTRAPCYLVVICPRPAVADWARKPINLGHPGFTLKPLVLGPGSGPLVTTPDQAAQMPELTVLCTLANVTPHTKESMEIAHAALATIENENGENGQLYTDMVLAVLSEAAKNILEEYVTTGTADYKFKSEPFLRHRAEGKAEGEAEMVLVVLEARGIPVSEQERERIMSCTDVRQLAAWCRRAVTAESIDELFA